MPRDSGGAGGTGKRGGGGNPDGEEKWVRSSVAKLTERLGVMGFSVSHNTVWRNLKRTGFSLRTHVRKRRGISPDPARRDEQFRYIASQRREFCQAGLPIISVDTKKKELIGDFRNPGKTWCRRPARSTSTTTPARRKAWRSLSASMTWRRIPAMSSSACHTTLRSSR